MISALGFSETEFDPTNPGRLCRGRERWIDPWVFEEAEDVPGLYRTVISGARFTDDSAHDAQRGLRWSGIELAQAIAAFFPRKTLYAFMEDGHPADIPEDAQLVEAYTGYRAGGASEAMLVRWIRKVSGVREIRALLGEDPERPQCLGFVLPESGVAIDADLQEALYKLTGMSMLDSPPACFQPGAIPEVLEHAKALILLHRDKHGPAVAVYTRKPAELEGKMRTLAKKHKAVFIRFEIPPMLARWDRAIGDTKKHWDEEADGPFPIPVSDRPARWESRRRNRRSRRQELADEAKQADLHVDTDASAPDEEPADPAPNGEAPVDEDLFGAEDDLFVADDTDA